MGKGSRPGSAWSQPAVLALAGVGVALLAFVYAIIRDEPLGLRHAEGPVPVLLLDPDGLPRTDVLVVGPDGRDVLPDGRGMIGLPADEGGRTYEVQDRVTRRWLRAFTLQIGTNGVLRVEVPR